MRVHRPTPRIPFALSLLALAASQAQAQQAAPGAVQEVVVTATRVTTTAQRTPVALSVYGGEALAEQGIATVEALHLGADLSVLAGDGPRSQIAALRELRVQDRQLLLAQALQQARHQRGALLLAELALLRARQDGVTQRPRAMGDGRRLLPALLADHVGDAVADGGGGLQLGGAPGHHHLIGVQA